MRLDKYISNCGAASRKEVRKLVKSGRITVDGAVAVKPEMNVDEKKSEIRVDGTVLRYREFIYLMLNKPKGYVSATEDGKHPFVTELIPKEYAHFNAAPVGRLDIDTEGLLILTNDGAFNHDMTSPKKHVYKKYFAVLDKEAEESDIEEFKKGMVFKEFTAMPAGIEICEERTNVFVTIAEGKFHQVKRMCERVGKKVVYLKRVSIGEVKLDETLKTGEIRELYADELALLKK